MTETQPTQAEAIQAVANAIDALSNGTEGRTGGFEGIAIALAGDGLKQPLGAALDDAAVRLTNPLDRIADALESIAYSLKQMRGDQG